MYGLLLNMHDCMYYFCLVIVAECMTTLLEIALFSVYHTFNSQCILLICCFSFSHFPFGLLDRFLFMITAYSSFYL